MFYIKLAATHVKQQQRYYRFYIISASIIVAIHLIFTLMIEPGNTVISIDGYITQVAYFVGNTLIKFLGCIFMMTSFASIVKKRHAEWGIYRTLGLTQKQVTIIILYEMLIVNGIALLIGSILGLLLTKFVFIQLIYFSGVPYIVLSKMSMPLIKHLIYFMIVYGLIALMILWIMKRQTIISMIKTKHQPINQKHNVITALLGILMVLVPYIASFYVTSVGLNLFFVLGMIGSVIVGTSLLFSSTLSLVLKQLERNPIFASSHSFIVIRQMKKKIQTHASSLASICTIATMLIVCLFLTAQTTFIIYQNFENSRHMFNVRVTGEGANKTIFQAIEKTNEDARGIMFNYNFFQFDTGESFTLVDESTIQLLTGTKSTSSNTIVAREQQSKEVEEIIAKLDIPFNVIYYPTDYLATIWVSMEEPLMPLDHTMLLIRYPFFGSGEKVFNQIDSMCNGQCEAVVFNTQNDEMTIAKSIVATTGVMLCVLLILMICGIVWFKFHNDGQNDQEDYQLFITLGMTQKEVKRIVKKQLQWLFLLPFLLTVTHGCFSMRMFYMNGLISVVVNPPFWLSFEGMMLGLLLLLIMFFIGLYYLALFAFYQEVELKTKQTIS